MNGVLTTTQLGRVVHEEGDDLVPSVWVSDGEADHTASQDRQELLLGTELALTHA